MPAVVWGTKVKEEVGGACALCCPGCGEVAIADEFVVSEAQHIYFIHGAFKEAQRYVCCRLCGTASEVPPGSRMSPCGSESGFIPTDEFVATTNPALARSAMPPPPPIELPQGVSRPQWAVLKTVNGALARQNDDDKVTGFTGGLALIAMFPILFLAAKVWNWSKENGAVTLAVMLFVGAGVFGSIYILHSCLVHRAVRKQVRAYVLNCLRHDGSKILSLSDATAKLGREFRKAGRHLAKCAGSYGLDR